MHFRFVEIFSFQAYFADIFTILIIYKMKSFLRLLMLICCIYAQNTALGQTLMPLPAHSTIYNGTVRGYWFTAPSNFTIVGLKVAPDAGTTDQFIHVMKINDPVPVAFPTTSANFTTLAYIANAPNNVIQTVNISVNAGDIIGILGAVGGGTANSYSASGTPFASNINSLPVALNRLLYQGAITTGPAPNYSTEGAGTPISRIEMYYTVGVPCSTNLNNASVLGPDEVCPKVNFNLTVGVASSNLNILGLKHQWQVSSNGTNWTNFTGTVDPSNGTLTDAITKPTYYRCIVTCQATSQIFTTAPKLVKIAPFYYCYCDMKATTTAGIDIGNLSVDILPSNINLLNNGIATPVENNATAKNGYTDFRRTVATIPMYHDSMYKLSISQINSAAFVAGMATIFIDYNRNGTFDDTERVLLQPTTNVLPNPGMVTGTYKLHDSAKYGLTGMRVVIGSGNSAPDTCGNFANGETEDYLVDLRYMPCTGKPDSAWIEGDTSMCIGYKYVLTDTVYEKYRHGIERFWQISADGVNWTDIAGSSNKDTLTRIFSGQPLYYRVQTVCTHSNDTASGHAHKVNVKPTYKCYCHSQSNGGIKDTSDIGAFTIANFSISDGGTHLLNAKAFSERQDRTDLRPIELDVDSIYNFTVFHTMPYQNHADGKVTVFVDFNNNKKYDIPEERIFTGFTSIGYHVLLNALIIPNNVIVNVPTGMRVIINNDVAPNIPSDEACGEYTSGETEDYIIVFKRPFPENINETAGINQLSLLPNPTTGKFTVQFKGAASPEGVTVRILNVTGQLVKQQVYPHNGGIFRQQVDIGNEAKGMYMVEITVNGQKMIEKLTVR
jgi:hypothetical protein